jgi:cysteine-rich repeat protein
MQAHSPDAAAVPDAFVAREGRDGAVAEPTDGANDEATDGAIAEPTDGTITDSRQEEAQPTCGNGRYDPFEECDDGNHQSGDGCSSSCKLECGDAGVAPCIDPGFFPQSPWTLCCGVGRLIVCGDGLLDAMEACDDGNATAGDGCPSDCTVVEPGFRCIVPGARCTPICGDGNIRGGETCDDGNRDPGDGCSPFCLTEPGWDCSTGVCVYRGSYDGGEPTLYCGDGIVSGAEECDVGPANGADGSPCSSECAYLYCGDGIVTGREECDVGRKHSTAYGRDRCTVLCTNAHFCGDGIVDSDYGEECDLGSANGGPIDGSTYCSTSCEIVFRI